MMTREQVAQLRLKAAAQHVENAQHELERACSALGSLNWMLPEGEKIARLRDRLHEAFYRLSPISHARAKACAKATLDRETEPGDEEPHKGCCAGFRPRVTSGDAERLGPAAGSTPAVSTRLCQGPCKQPITPANPETKNPRYAGVCQGCLDSLGGP